MQYHIFSPYRVSPLGAHVDHQKGLVTGFALDKGVDLEFDISPDGRVNLQSKDFEGDITFDISTPSTVRQGDWGDYARGAKYALQKRFALSKGISGTIKGSLPIGGLSASAAVLVAYVMAFARANEITLTPFEVMKISSEAEREYIGLNNGMLDHACIALGQKDCLLMLDCEYNDYELYPKPAVMPDFEIGIFYSGLARTIVHTDYNLRVAESRTSAWIIKAFENDPLKPLDRTFLRDVPESSFRRNEAYMPPRFKKRAEHFYSECNRVREGVGAWERGDLAAFGALSIASCESSIINYECGSPELISIYEALREQPGVYGGRFSGAGFRGSCIALVDPAAKDEIARNVTERYLARFPLYRDDFKVFFCSSGDGARFVQQI